MTDLDPRIGELLDARTPREAVTADWDAVLRRAAQPARRARRRRRPSPGWLLLAAALAVPAGLAAARAGHSIVRYLTGPATPAQRAAVRPLVRPFVAAPAVHGDLARARQLVSIALGGHRYVFVMVPLTRRSDGGCFYEIVDRHRVDANDCGFDPQGRHPRTSPPGVVGAGTALGAEDLQVAYRPLWVVLGVMPGRVRSVVVHFQGGATAPAPTNGRFFSYVVRGRHATAGHRPTALVGLTASGGVRAVQLLDPEGFDGVAVQHAGLEITRELNVLYLSHNASHGVAPDQIRQFDRISTTPTKVARMFGGRPQSYPAHPVVVVLRGPFSVTIQKRGCGATPQVCPVPVGRWAYLAYVIDPDVSLAGRVPPGAIAWLRKAPAGTPFPDLRRLGEVIHVRFR